jgi:hypothetical protein
MLDGMVGLTEEILGMPARQSCRIRGLMESHPVYTTAIGLAIRIAGSRLSRKKKSKGKGSH